MEKLSEKCDQKPIIEFEGFTIRPFDGWTLWLENPSGEDTQIRKIEFLAWLNRLFVAKF